MEIECDSVDVSSRHVGKERTKVIVSLYGIDEGEILDQMKDKDILDHLGEDTVRPYAIDGMDESDFLERISDNALLDAVISRFTTKQILEALDEVDVAETVTEHFLGKIG
jgi:hypothetical protein